MNKIGKIALGTAAAICLSLTAGCSSEAPFMGNTRETALEEGDVFAVISIMDYGDITVKLFPEAAPMAVTRFITLAENNYYDGRSIHRVVEDQLIQGGSLTGSGFDGEVAKQEYFDIETSDYMRHYYGALCMASNANGNYCQFYIVNNNTKVKIDEIAEKLKEDLDNNEISAGLLESDKEYYNEYYNKLHTMPDEVKERYAQVGGIYDLDGTDTVFGQVVDGWEILSALNGVETVAGNVSDDRSGIYSKPLDEIIIEKIVVIHITPVETTTEEKTRATRATTSGSTDSAGDNIIINDGEDYATSDEAAVTAGEAETAEPEETSDDTGSAETAENDADEADETEDTGDSDDNSEDTSEDNAEDTSEDNAADTSDDNSEDNSEDGSEE